jgi:flagella basal body P-ring formation protein FlgA
MMFALALPTLLALAAPTPTADAAAVEALVRTAVSSWAAEEGAQIEVRRIKLQARAGCPVSAVEPPPGSLVSGKAVLRLRREGDGECGWATVSLARLEPVLVAVRGLRQGEAIAGAVAVEHRALTPGQRPAPHLTHDVLTARSVAAGAVITAGDVTVRRPKVGSRVDVALISGALTLKTFGHVIPCRRADEPSGTEVVCARLPSGKRVQGPLADGRVVVENP